MHHHSHAQPCAAVEGPPPPQEREGGGHPEVWGTAPVLPPEAEGFPPERIVRIPNGVPIPEWQKENYGGAQRIVCVSRCRPEKGLDILLQAFAIVAAKHNAVTLDVAGGGEEMAALKRMAVKAGLCGRITFHGDVADVTPLLKEADVFVLPSRAEGLSNALLEAMAAGLACVATAVGGNRELIADGESGLLCAPENPAALAHALKRMLTDAALRERAGRAARGRVEKQYAIETVAARYERLYGALLAKDENGYHFPCAHKRHSSPQGKPIRDK